MSNSHLQESPFVKAKKASRKLIKMSDENRNKILLAVADSMNSWSGKILEANKKDLARMEKSNPSYDRLLLSKKRLLQIAEDIRKIVSFPSPIGSILESRQLSNGLKLERITVPIGVIGVIYEARPNVTFDVFSLCFKAGNSCLLKGGADAKDSNSAIVSMLYEILKSHGVSTDVLQLLEPTREAVREMLHAVGYIDVIIPRGSKVLIDFVREHSKVPVIETGAGVVHIYLDKEVNLENAKNVIFNAKTRRVSVCNALDSLLVHRDSLKILPTVLAPLADKRVEIFADDSSFEELKDSYPRDLLKKVTPSQYGIEFLDYKMSCFCVDDLDQALEYIQKYSSRHSDAILSDDPESIEKFLDLVDSAVVYANTSTAFTDGAQFGLGAEIGISTQKLPPRGPMGLRDLATYKWKVRGEGQVRP